MKICSVRRDDRFSPNSIEKDRLILSAVASRLSTYYNTVVVEVDEADVQKGNVEADIDIFITMARDPKTLAILAEKEKSGSLVVNSAESVRRCQRSVLDRLMRDNNIAMPPITGQNGYWLKRGDAAAQSKSDIIFCPDDEALEEAKKLFLSRGITDMVVSSHVIGDLMKFYGVGSDFFQCYYPSDDGISKFGDETINGKAHHYAFNQVALHQEVVRLSQLTGVAVYGGDAVIDKTGHFYIIDFNDWPSFSRCREEAANAISSWVKNIILNP